MATIRKSLLIVVPLLLIVLAVYWAVKSKQRADLDYEQSRRESMRTQIAEARAGKLVYVHISDEADSDKFAMDEFVKASKSFQPTDRFDIYIAYSHDIDNFFERIAGVPGIRSVVVDRSGLTDVGVGYIASLPDLEKLSIHQTEATDKAIVQLQSVKGLNSFTIEPIHSIGVSKILSLPQLRKLKLIDPPNGGWINYEFENLKQGRSLEELTLITDGPNDEQIDELRKQHPNCNIVVETRRNYGR